MSEADADEPASARGREVWIEKYRPETLADIKGHENITERLQSYISRDDLPHLMFAGPAGTGKCVTGETPVLTNHGVERMESIVGDVDGFGDVPSDTEVATFTDNGNFEYTNPSAVFGKQTTELRRIETRDGGRMTVTPEHKLLVASADGLEWIRAANLSAGDRIARPLDAPMPNPDAELNWLTAMDGDRTLVHVTATFARENEIPDAEQYTGNRKQVAVGISRGDTVSELAEETGLAEKTVQQYRRETVSADQPNTVCSLSYLRELNVGRGRLKQAITGIQYESENGHLSDIIKPAWELTPALARFVGLAVSEARIEGARVKFYNTDEGLLTAFENAAESVFGIIPEAGEQQDVPYRELRNRALTHLLESCFTPFHTGDEQADAIGTTLVRAPAESRRAFLQAMFDAEAHVAPNGEIELTQKDGRTITLLSYLLAGEGIPSRRTTTDKTASNGTGAEREYHTLYVSGAPHLQQFEKKIGFRIDRKAEQLAENAARASNPNHDTIPTQHAVDTLCNGLNLSKKDHIAPETNPETPGRKRYLDGVDTLLDAATERLDTAQAALERLTALQTDIQAAVGTPTQWVRERSKLEPLETRREVSADTGVRSDRLLEYADGRRTPNADRAAELLNRLDGTDSQEFEQIRSELDDIIHALGVSYEQVAEGTEMRGNGINSLLSEGNDLSSLTRFETVSERLRTLATEMCSRETVAALDSLHRLTAGTLYFDTVGEVKTVSEPQRVYDLTVPETRNYVAGAVPTVMHNTTAATAIARELYGEDWRENFLELNASDQRGIDVVRDRIKSFARSSFGGYDYRVIFLDEADALTSDAQSALRRTMEQFSNNTRFILSCNYSSQIIDPIQSRCAVFRFSPLADEAVAAQVREIAEAESIEITEAGVDALVYAADGDMRKAINGLQAAAVMDDTVDEEGVYAITSTARPEEIEEIVELALEGDFPQARAKLDTLLTEVGIAGGDIIDQLHRSVWEFDLPDRATVELMDEIGEVDYRITAGANEQVQLEALLASLALDEE
ncbi:replication factor C small subunit [Halosegnis longus]